MMIIVVVKLKRKDTLNIKEDKMNSKNKSLKILSVSWGAMEIETLGSGKDFKLWPGGGRAWNWQETGTEHSPGIQIADVQELLENGCQIIVLTKGKYSRLKTKKETLAFLEENGVKTIIEETTKAVKIYNNYVEQHAMVGGLFHSTC